MHRDESAIATAVSTYVNAGVMSRDQVRARFLAEGPIDDDRIPQWGPIPDLSVSATVPEEGLEEGSTKAADLEIDITPPENKTTKLSHEQAEEIRALYALGSLNQTQIALHYSVSQRTISKIVRQELYKT